jgi:hypothetical protein
LAQDVPLTEGLGIAEKPSKNAPKWRRASNRGARRPGVSVLGRQSVL